jgi:flavin reductase (DIM6/NTAB) family NADH-FMN oxidoreductase RutF
MKIDPVNLNPQDSAHLLTDIVIPRPIAWVSTVDLEGRFNLAPFSAYGMVSSKPMVVGFSVSTYRDGKKKDTLLNVTATREFVVNLVTEALVQKMNMTASDYPHDVSEFDKAELTPVKADLVKAPVVGESPMNMECRVLQIIEFGKLPTVASFIIGEVLRVHIRNEYYNQDAKRISGLRAIGRLGGAQDLYCLGQDTFELKRQIL